MEMRWPVINPEDNGVLTATVTPVTSIIASTYGGLTVGQALRKMITYTAQPSPEPGEGSPLIFLFVDEEPEALADEGTAQVTGLIRALRSQSRCSHSVGWSLSPRCPALEQIAAGAGRSRVYHVPKIFHGISHLSLVSLKVDTLRSLHITKEETKV